MTLHLTDCFMKVLQDFDMYGCEIINYQNKVIDSKLIDSIEKFLIELLEFVFNLKLSLCMVKKNVRYN